VDGVRDGQSERIGEGAVGGNVAPAEGRHIDDRPWETPRRQLRSQNATINRHFAAQSNTVNPVRLALQTESLYCWYNEQKGALLEVALNSDRLRASERAVQPYPDS